MKKIAITLSAATLLLGGLVGCWGEPQGTGGLGADQRGFGMHQTEQRPGTGTGFTGQRAGEGPITDMFTRDDRRGARGFGRDVRQPATGFTGERGRGGMFGQGAAGRGGAAGQGVGLGMQGRGADFGAEGGAGLGNQGRGAGFGTGTGFFGLGDRGKGLGTRDHGTGFGGMEGQFGGRTGAGRGAMQFENQIPGARGAGVVGDRPGYVDDRGILRGREATGRAGIGGLGRDNRTLQDERAGVGHGGAFGLNGRQGVTGQAGNRTGMRDFAYPDGYDTQTVNRITTRLADVEDVRDSRVIVHDNRILVGVDANGQDPDRIKKNVSNTVGDMAGDREVIVVTERDQYNQIRTMDDRLRAGEPFEQFGRAINEMFHDFGRATRPLAR